MGLFERIVKIFKGNKIEALPSEGTSVEKFVLLATTEKNPQKVMDILCAHSCEMKSSDIIQIISHLPIEYRVDGIDIANNYITPYDLSEISVKSLDFEGKMTVLEEFQDRMGIDDINKIFDSIQPDRRFSTLKKCADRYDSYGIAEIIRNYIPLYERLDALNYFKKRLDPFSKTEIIRNMDDDRKIKALELYGKELGSGDLVDIICNSCDKKMHDVLNSVYQYLNSNQIRDIIKYNVPEENRTEMLYKCCYKLDSASITDLIKDSIPECERENAVISLQNRMEKTNVGEALECCIESTSTLDKVRHNLTPEDIEYFEKKLA